MTAQTSYTIDQGNAYAGQLFDVGPQVRISRSAEGIVPFGVAVVRGTDADRQAAIGAAADGSLLGISYRSLEREGAANTGEVDYSDKDTVGILQDGRIYAVCPTGCIPGAAVKAVNATGILDSGAAGVGETQLDDAQWDSTAAAGAIGVIRLSGLNTTAGS